MDQYDLVAHLYRQRAFSRATFGPGDRTLGVTDHIMKEVEEVREARAKYEEVTHTTPLDVVEFRLNNLQKEWVDLVLLSLDGLWRTGVTPERAVELIREKQEKNENRNWPDWRTADPNAAIQHVKE